VDEESDEDPSEDDEEEKSQDTIDTQVVEELNVVGQALYDDTRCLIGLSLKVKGHQLYCGYPKRSCPRRKHRELQTEPGRRGPTGVYQQLPNGKALVHDAVASTRITPEDWENQRQVNHELLLRLGASPQKSLTETLLKPPSTPRVRIDTTHQSGPRNQFIASISKGLPASSSASRPTPRKLNQPATTTTNHPPNVPNVSKTANAPAQAPALIVKNVLLGSSAASMAAGAKGINLSVSPGTTGGTTSQTHTNQGPSPQTMQPATQNTVRRRALLL
jgi:hypothetical protein